MANISTGKIRINMLKGNEVCSDIFTRYPQFKGLFAALSYTDRGGDSLEDIVNGYTEEFAAENHPLYVINENSCILSGRWVVTENFTFYREDTRRLMNEVKALGYTGLSISFWDMEPGEEAVSAGRMEIMLDGADCTVDTEGLRVSFQWITDKLGLKYPDFDQYMINDPDYPEPDYDYEALNKAQDAFEDTIWDAITEKDTDWFGQYGFKKSERVIIPMKDEMK